MNTSITHWLSGAIKTLLILWLILSIELSAGAALPNASTIERPDLPPFSVEGSVEKVWFEYGVKVKDEVGLGVHTKFSVKNAQNVPCAILANIQRFDGHSFAASGNTYATKDGKAVLMAKPFTPPYESTDYADIKLFFPYWALRLEGENANKMKAFVILSCGGREFARSATVDFGLAVGKVR